MKIYKHEYSMSQNKLQTFEYEAEEKAKSYTLVNRGRILKTDIDVLSNTYTWPSMFSLSPDPSFFLSSLLSFTEEEIKREEERLEKRKKNRENVLQEIEKRKGEK